MVSSKRALLVESQEAPLEEHQDTKDDDFEDGNDDDTNRQSQSDDSRDEIEEIKKIIREETKVVRNWRWVVIIAMLIVGGAVTTATYIFLSNEEDDDFENAFKQFATTLLESSTFSASTIRSSCQDFADQVTTTMRHGGNQWPYVVIPDFQVHAQNLRRQTSSIGFLLFPLIQQQERSNWTKHVLTNSDWYTGPQFVPDIWYFNNSRPQVYDQETPGPFLPVWLTDPLPVTPLLNLDAFPFDIMTSGYDLTLLLEEGVVGDVLTGSFVDGIFPSGSDEPQAFYYQPLYDSFDKESRKFVGQLLILLRWNVYFSDILPDGVRGISLVLENTCNDTATWEIEGKTARFVGLGDLHDDSYDSYKLSGFFNTYTNVDAARAEGACIYTINIYPSSVFEDDYHTSSPIYLTVVVGTVFLSMVAAFLAYDMFQRKRNTKVVANAAKSNALVSSLFPSNIRDRLLDQPANNKKKQQMTSHMGKLQNFLDGGNMDDEGGSHTPIADLFLETTIMFADITDFTAWSSMREPTQVFTLLENVFSALDRLAQKRRIFKVETVGDCYVAVAGLPEKRKDHAVAMARFAMDALLTTQEVVKRLEMTLGPDTGDLGVRIGLHSGSVTAGVLRGERARFQLFGDTINTTARIESTGRRNRIHMSKETADLLMAAGKGHWAKPREDVITAKGKGELKTYWLDIKDDGSVPVSTADNSGSDTVPAVNTTDSKTTRLIDWQVDVLSRFLKQIVARRNVGKQSRSNLSMDLKPDNNNNLEWNPQPGKICLDEVQEIIWLPEFDADAARNQDDPLMIELDDAVILQLRAFISAIANLYRNNSFHSFEHACHVTMSVTKLLSRIVMPSDLEYVQNNKKTEQEGTPHDEQPDEHNTTIESTLHDHTYGITSDPLTQFSLVFAALIHDVDHTGVPNTVLIEENTNLASAYRGKSVAEQNSIDLSWKLLQSDQYKDLRACIYSTKDEFARFRQLVVQAVLATDIADKELKVLRNARWDSAFADQYREEDPLATVNRKATIVIEHLIQASDVAHTMQHWHIYRKWNENFFHECYRAFQEGRAETDPSLNWYQGEIGFFDFYIIPLAKKLKKCGVFGVSSDECLNYALKNRQEWQDRGKEVVEEMMQAMLVHNSNNHAAAANQGDVVVTRGSALGGLPRTIDTVAETEDFWDEDAPMTSSC